MAADELMPSHRSHRTPKSGPTMRKKSEIDKKKRGISVNKQKNPKVVTTSPLFINVFGEFLCLLR